MSIFFDPHTRKVKPWIYVVFIAVPILIIIGLILSSSKVMQDFKKEKQQEQTSDIFAK